VGTTGQYGGLTGLMGRVLGGSGGERAGSLSSEFFELNCC
jgi:hypothetical protein